jgi:hypothetical protein
MATLARSLHLEGSGTHHGSGRCSWGNGVSSIVVLEDIELIPVLKLEPFRFAAGDRSAPSGIYEDMPENWYRY